MIYRFLKVSSIGLFMLFSHFSLAASNSMILFNGGIGLEERAAAPTGGLKLVFATQSGHYLSLVKVQIRDQSGKLVLAEESQGPWLILQLPAGSYRVLASATPDNTQGLMINADSTNRQYILSFKE